MCLADASHAKDSDAEKSVRQFYDALATGQCGKLRKVLGAQVEHRFYGPPAEMKLFSYLSGLIKDVLTFKFDVKSVYRVNANVITVEGIGLLCCSRRGTAHVSKRSWVHVWFLKANKLVELREYYDSIVNIVSSKSDAYPNLSTLWQSKTSKLYMSSYPSLLLII
ncbi:hypothetical protein KP509_30G024000 [Ceratopteris richardii]|uniref:Uncharacterized protein n=1 Tax=Ceratopteris richardii TaxID=49495 RepID=A0A8T2R1U7_CERRI|nr:hypothetical protein KP509_30G024000 [Ceratopteris richardii]